MISSSTRLEYRLVSAEGSRIGASGAKPGEVRLRGSGSLTPAIIHERVDFDVGHSEYIEVVILVYEVLSPISKLDIKIASAFVETSLVTVEPVCEQNQSRSFSNFSSSMEFGKDSSFSNKAQGLA